MVNGLLLLEIDFVLFFDDDFEKASVGADNKPMLALSVPNFFKKSLLLLSIDTLFKNESLFF